MRDALRLTGMHPLAISVIIDSVTEKGGTQLFGIQCFAVFWLVLSVYFFYTFMRHVINDDDEAQDERKEIGGLYVGLGLVMLLIDVAGLVLTYNYAELRPWQEILLYVSIAALLLDGGMDARKIRDMLKAINNGAGSDVIVAYLDSSSAKWNAVSFVAIGGKVVLAAILVLWTVFPR